MAAHEFALLSVVWFLVGLSSSLSLLFSMRSGVPLTYLLPGLILVDVSLLKCCLQGEKFQVGIRSSLLGLVFSCGMLITVLGIEEVKVFGIYTCILSFFHFSEFLAIAVTNPSVLTIRAFVLDNGWEYKTAAVCCAVEFFVEAYLFPWMKTVWIVSSTGLLMCIFGEALRKLSMWTASTNFNHEVQSEHVKGHVLVVHGVYHYMRHPSYVGWFIWSIGSQVLLMNPFCMIGYTVVSWKFFYQRIYFEEISLLKFFGEEYLRYQQTTGTGLPFIKGFLLEEQEDEKEESYEN